MKKIITYFKKLDILINNHEKQLQKLKNFKQNLFKFFNKIFTNKQAFLIDFTIN